MVGPGSHWHLDPRIASLSVAPEEPAALLTRELRGEVRPQRSGFLREPAQRRSDESLPKAEVCHQCPPKWDRGDDLLLDENVPVSALHKVGHCDVLFLA